MSDDYLSPVTLDELQCRAQWVTTYAAGRRCCHDGCKTILSRYNGGEFCGAHEPEPNFLRYLGQTFAICDTCGKVKIPRQSFRRMKTGSAHKFSTTCIRCENDAERASMSTSGGVAACIKCGKTKPATPMYFLYRKDDGRREKTCRTCRQKRARENYCKRASKGNS